MTAQRFSGVKKIITYHVLAFVLGALGIALYFFFKVSSGGVALAVVGSVIAVVYVVGWGVLCTFSLGMSFLMYRHRKK